MKYNNKPLRVVHQPQLGMTEAFTREVENEKEAWVVMEVLADQHLWLHKNGFISDYNNTLWVEMFSEGKWDDYFNEEEHMEWEEFRETYLEPVES